MANPTMKDQDASLLQSTWASVRNGVSEKDWIASRNKPEKKKPDRFLIRKLSVVTAMTQFHVNHYLGPVMFPYYLEGICYT
jgi:hypothetical protein